MSGESDSNSHSSSSSKEYRRRKKQKKHKRKSEKRSKNIKKDKKNRKHKDTKSESPLATQIVASCESTAAEAFGPALPPHLLQQKQEVETSQVEEAKVIGPSMPSNYQLTMGQQTTDINNDTAQLVEEEDNTVEIFGPMPAASGSDMNTTQIQLEQRALELKLAALEGTSTATKEQKEREEWMLELPAVGLRGGLAALNNMKRTFHFGKEKPDFSDRSVWTKTPNSSNGTQKAPTSKDAIESLKLKAQASREKQRDAEQEAIAKSHKKKHKREESLVELHQKKLRKEQKKKDMELAASGAKPPRRPFSRDTDLKLNIIDKNQTKQIVDKAKLLNTKFATGQTKYL